jgi:hypothetical protein
MIRVLGSSSVLAPNIFKTDGYVAILKDRFPSEEFIVDGKVRGTTEMLMEYSEVPTMGKPILLNILHFRADEWFELHEKQKMNRCEKLILLAYNKTSKNSSKNILLSRSIHFVCKLMLLRARKLGSRVSRQRQLINFERFLENYEQDHFLTLVIIDTRIRFLSPALENIERSYRSKILKTWLSNYTRARYLDYSDLRIDRTHFQRDKLHLSTIGNALLANAICELVQTDFEFFNNLDSRI